MKKFMSLGFGSSVLTAVCAFSVASGALADDWPQWQGPTRDAVSKETGLLKEWPKGGPPLAWKVKGLGGGYNEPSIVGGRIFGMSSRGDYEIVWARSEADGKELWATRLGPAVRSGMRQGIEGPGCTPTVDGKVLYVEGMGGQLACVQVEDGKIIWQKGLIQDFGGRSPTWRYNESPLIEGEKLICTPGGAEATIVALDKANGKLVWKCAVPGSGGGSGRGGGGSGAAYSSAIAIDFEGQRQIVQFTSKTLVGVAANDGKLLWRYDRPANRSGINISTAVYHDGMIFAASAYGAGGGLVKLSKDAGGGVKATEVYATRNMQNHHGGMILLDGYLYGANGGNEGGNLVCLEFATGKVMWDGKVIDRANTPKGSILLADGRLYYRHEAGTMTLLEPSPKEYIERGRFEQPDRTQQPDWAHPVIANGKLYLRDQDELFCYDVKGK